MRIASPPSSRHSRTVTSSSGPIRLSLGWATASSSPFRPPATRFPRRSRRCRPRALEVGGATTISSPEVVPWMSLYAREISAVLTPGTDVPAHAVRTPPRSPLTVLASIRTSSSARRALPCMAYSKSRPVPEDEVTRFSLMSHCALRGRMSGLVHDWLASRPDPPARVFAAITIEPFASAPGRSSASATETSPPRTRFREKTTSEGVVPSEATRASTASACWCRNQESSIRSTLGVASSPGR